MTTTTKTQKISPTMRSALHGLFVQAPGLYNCTGRAAAGILQGALVASKPTRQALLSRKLVRRQSGKTGPYALFQITPEACEAIGRSMDEIVAWAWGEAVEEYCSRCISPTPEGGYNLMTEIS
jgi:hypothetical protein